MDILVVVTAILTAVAFGLWFITRRFAGLLNPPLRVRVVPDDSGGGLAKKMMQQYRPILDARGFDEIGMFRIPELPGLIMTAYTQPYQMVCAVVYDHPLTGCFVDVFSENERGQSLTVSNAPAGTELDQPPGHDKVIDKTMSVADLYDYLLRHRPSGPHVPIDASNFAAEFEAAYAREMNWRKNRGGVTEDEVRRSAEAMGITSEKAVQTATGKLQREFAQKEND
jgi:hypothetical protein